MKHFKLCIRDFPVAYDKVGILSFCMIFPANVSLIFSCQFFLLPLFMSLKLMFPESLKHLLPLSTLQGKSQALSQLQLYLQADDSHVCILTWVFPECQLSTRHLHVDGLSAYPTQHFQTCTSYHLLFKSTYHKFILLKCIDQLVYARYLSRVTAMNYNNNNKKRPQMAALCNLHTNGKRVSICVCQDLIKEVESINITD